MNKPTVLIVEDELINRKILSKILEDSYTVVEAADGTEAWTLLQAHHSEYAAMLLDLVMPGMNGYLLLEKLQAAHMDDLPVIVTTGALDADTEKKALDSGAWDYVAKPYNATVLKSRLRNAVARSQMASFEKLRYLANHDPLTGLYNRSMVFAKTQSLLALHKDMPFVFIRLDLDHFAQYNTAFGESEGDRLLIHMTRCIVDAMSTYDHRTFGRISADIFCVCCPYTGGEQGLRERIAQAQKQLSAYRTDYQLELSAGVYIIEDHTASMEDIYYRACLATRRCKNRYGEHLAFYDAAAEQAQAREMAITNEMQAALDEQQFVLYYQPKYSLLTEKSTGAEALVRWQHPVRGMVSPGEFIPVFEKNGFISKLDYYVWEHTCQALQRWQQAGYRPKPVSVNVSRISLYNPQLVETITELTRRYDIPSSLLQLEITESAYMANPQLMESTISHLQEAGFTILMDDFGSGESSLNTLKRIRVDVLKVDMKFLPVAGEAERSEIILACVVKMARWLGMSVVVEGVETRRQRDFLEGVGCEQVQGYYYARPMPREEYEQDYVIPVDDAASSVTSRTAAALKDALTVLVVDDSETERIVLQENIGEMYSLHLCDSAESALAYLNTHAEQVKLILLDNVMPGMSGLDFIRFCQQDPVLKAIPKIMITANDTAETQVAAFKAGAYDYLVKPLTREVLMARVSHVMDLCRSASVFETLQHEYAEKSQQDSATGLLNKVGFNSLLERVLIEEPESEDALLVVDIDNFKLINDRHGHLLGDQVIIGVAEELQRTFRKTDIIGRFGGDEFVVLMTRITAQDIVKRKAKELITNVMMRCHKQLNLTVSVSIGVSFSRKEDTTETLFSRADQALYEAKADRKGTVVVYGERVPPVCDDDKPIVLVCGCDEQFHPTIALAYGDSAAFAAINTLAELKDAFIRYPSRIRAVCMDIARGNDPHADEFYRCILEHGGGKTIPILATYREGSMKQLKAAARLEIADVLALPADPEVIRRRLASALLSTSSSSEPSIIPIKKQGDEAV